MGLRLVAVVLTAWLGLGCFVLDELDAAEDLMEKPSFAEKQKKQPAAKEQPRPAAEKAQPNRPSVRDWWKKTRSLTSGEVSSEFVSCELNGATQFMHRPDCLARGGTPRNAGG
jgi:hypothetical protein